MKPIMRDDLKPPTMATDGRNLYFHPKFVEDHSQEVIEAAVAHEVGHCALNHVTRRGARQPKRWNYAIDYATNAMLEDCGFNIPDWFVHNAAFKGMSAEEIYTLLPPEDEGGSGNSNHGGKEPFDQHMDSKDENLAAELEVATIQAAQAQRGRGELPGSLKRFCPDLAEAKVDWRAVLRRFATDAARDDFSWMKPNRAYMSLGFIMPGLYSESVRDITTVIDTSGSINDQILSAFGGEIADIRNNCELKLLRTMYCDAAINHVDEFEQHDHFAVTPHGDGGTDFRPPFKWLQERDITPTCLIYLTDGYGPFPASAPPYPVLWVMTTDIVPPFGEHVRIQL
jgi:predicted metal-dependent peptidase